MSKVQLTPWHEVCKLREDLRSGELSLSIFAADLYDVVMGTAKPVYQDPREFFSLTYATHNIRELAKDIILRLAGKNEKAVRQLVLTYGGGKTHTLIALYHLVSDPDALPDLPAVEEFVQHAGMRPPKACVGTNSSRGCYNLSSSWRGATSRSRNALFWKASAIICRLAVCLPDR